MSRHQFMEDCPGCRPVAIKLTGEPMPDDAINQAMGRAFDRMPFLHRAAWHRVTCLNSRSMLDLALAREVVAAMQAEVNSL